MCPENERSADKVRPPRKHTACLLPAAQTQLPILTTSNYGARQPEGSSPLRNEKEQPPASEVCYEKQTDSQQSSWGQFGI